LHFSYFKCRFFPFYFSAGKSYLPFFVNCTHGKNCQNIVHPGCDTQRKILPDRETRSYTFIPGQATEISIHKEGWKDERRPFTSPASTNGPSWNFTIKSYHDHDGVTNELSKLKPGDELILRDVWGAIAYKGEGYFIAGGAGITPFIAISGSCTKKVI